MSQPNALWIKLQAHGIVVGTSPVKEQIESPWYVKTLLAISAWIASILLFIFVALLFNDLFDNVAACLVIGGLMIAGAFYIFRQKSTDFMEHLGLASSLAGQVLIAIAFVQMLDESWLWLWAIGMLFQGVLSLVMPNFVHRVLSSYSAAFAFSMVMYELGIPYLVAGIVMFLAAWIWLNEFNYPRHHKMFRAIGYGLVLAMIQMKGSVMFLEGEFLHSASMVLDFGVRPWMGEVLSCAALLFVVWQLLRRYRVSLTSPIAMMAFALTLFVGLASVEANGITVGLMVLVLGFSNSNRVLMGLGIVSLLFYISAYYYFLNVTLLEKSFILLVIGVLLLLIRWILNHCSVFNLAMPNA